MDKTKKGRKSRAKKDAKGKGKAKEKAGTPKVKPADATVAESAKEPIASTSKDPKAKKKQPKPKPKGKGAKKGKSKEVVESSDEEVGIVTNPTPATPSQPVSGVENRASTEGASTVHMRAENPVGNQPTVAEHPPGAAAATGRLSSGSSTGNVDPQARMSVDLPDVERDDTSARRSEKAVGSQPTPGAESSRTSSPLSELESDNQAGNEHGSSSKRIRDSSPLTQPPESVASARDTRGEVPARNLEGDTGMAVDKAPASRGSRGEAILLRSVV